MLSLQDISNFNDKFERGEELELDYVKDTILYILNSEMTIKSQLSSLKVAELKKMIWDTRYTKKADLVDCIYSSQVDKIYFFISGERSLCLKIDGHSDSLKQQKDNLMLKAFSELTEEKLKELLKDKKEKYEARQERNKQFLESIKNPKTLIDFEKARGIRDLTVEEQRTYEELKASAEKEKEREKEVELAKKISSNGSYSIEKTNDTRDGRDLWVVKFEEKSDDFKALNRQMKELGGTGYSRYTRGFNFYFDPKDKLENLFLDKTDEETTAESNSIEESPTLNINTKAVEKLRTVANNMQREIDNKLSSDRLVNTARRARMAANAEKEGEYLKKVQSILYNIANLIESGEAKYLDKISAKTHVETLEDILRNCERKYISIKSKEKYPDEKDYSNLVMEYEKKLREKDDTLFNSIDVAEYPLSSCHRNFIKKLLDESSDVNNTLMLRRRLLKLLDKKYANIDCFNTKYNSEDIVELYEKGKRAGKFEYFNSSDIDNYKRLKVLGLKDTIMLRAALREYFRARGDFQESEEDKKKREIKEIQRSLVGIKIPGYFPTPAVIVEELLEYADIQEGDTILEPSAGSGHIADMIKEKYPNNNLDVVEYNSSLSQILEKKGHNVIASNFLTLNLKENSKDNSIIVEGYDKIIMNPPFEKNQDIEHVLHAFSLLKPGGKVVAIMSEHPFFALDRKSEEFREWLDNQNQSFDKKLPEGSFLESDRSTGVNTRIVTIRKPKFEVGELINEEKETTDEKKKVTNLYDQLLQNKVDIFYVMKLGLNLNNYAADFITLYHKKILEMLQNKNEKLKEIVLDYLIRFKYENVDSINFYEIGRIINSHDFKREEMGIRGPILLALKELVKDDMPNIKKIVETYRENIKDTKIGIMKSNMVRSIRLNAEKLNIDPNLRGSRFDLFRGESPSIDLMNEALILFNKLELDLIKAGSINNFKNVLRDSLKVISEKSVSLSSDKVTIWNDFKGAVEDYLDVLNKKDTPKTSSEPSQDVEKIFRYYLTSRPPSIGTHPTGAIKVESFDTKEFVEDINRDAWGFVEYDKQLTPIQIHDYELKELKTLELRKEEAEKELRFSGVAYNGVKSVKIVSYLYEKDRFNVEIIDDGNRFNTALNLGYDDCISSAVTELFNKESKPVIISVPEDSIHIESENSELKEKEITKLENSNKSSKTKSKRSKKEKTFEQLSFAI